MVDQVDRVNSSAGSGNPRTNTKALYRATHVSLVVCWGEIRAQIYLSAQLRRDAPGGRRATERYNDAH